MSPEAFQRRLRETMYSTMSVRRDPQWAATHGFHPDAYLVWDTSTRGEPYVVFVCQRRGIPHEPNDEMVAAIRSMDGSRVHGGRKSWSGEVVERMAEQERTQERLRERAFRERFDFDFVPRVNHFAHHGRVYGVAKV